MSTHIKNLASLASAILAVGVMVLSDTLVQAATNPGNDAAAMVVRIRPNADRGVTIATGTGGFLDLGYVDLGNSTSTLHPATVTIQGNMINTELDLSASITGGWVFDNDDQIKSSSGTNQLSAFVQFTSISTGLAPAQDNEYFRTGTSSGTKITSLTQTFPATQVGLAGSSGIGAFENNEEGNADMDSMAPASERHMFTYFTLPPATSVTADQYINFVLAVKAGP